MNDPQATAYQSASESLDARKQDGTVPSHTVAGCKSTDILASRPHDNRFLLFKSPHHWVTVTAVLREKCKARTDI